MLSEIERAGVRDVLNLMDETDVISLAQTLTNRLVKLESLKDAIDAICLYAASASRVLSRRKVKKEVLFRYLHQQKVAADPHGEKLVIVNAVLTLWQSPLCQDLVEVATAPKHEVKYQSLAESAHSTVAVNSPVQQMGEAFITWFYRLLNSENAKFANPDLTGKFGAHHFWIDCKLGLELQSPQELVEHSCCTAEEVASSLRKVVLQMGLFFNPNVSQEGVETMRDAHGLVTVKASGVVHNTETCVGVFKQIFGLVRDMTKLDNWKIKFTNLSVICNNNGKHALPASQNASQVQLYY